jgi:hypothetical protein
MLPALVEHFHVRPFEKRRVLHADGRVSFCTMSSGTFQYGANTT